MSVGENGVILLSSDGKFYKTGNKSSAKFTDIIYANNKFITVSDAIYTSKFGRYGQEEKTQWFSHWNNIWQ